jgi:hypothetical protein
LILISQPGILEALKLCKNFDFLTMQAFKPNKSFAAFKIAFDNKGDVTVFKTQLSEKS